MSKTFKRAQQKKLFGFTNIDVQQNRRLGRIEKKIRDSTEQIENSFSLASAAMNATPVVLHMVPAGAEGLKAKLLSFEIHGVVKQDLTSAIIDDYRVDLVLDRHPNKIAETATIIYGSATPSNEEYVRINEGKRFKILRSWRGYLSSSEGSMSFRKIDAKIKLNVIVESLTSDTFTATSIIKNNLSLLHWTTATANQPTFQHKIRLVSNE